MIDQVTREKILDTANIVDVVSEFVTLRRRGVNYVGLCPFHTDKTPSFYVSPAKNICKCFACGEGGSPVYFIMKHEQLSYHDALRFLAKKYHIEVQERPLSDQEKQRQGDRESMFIINNRANKHFISRLYEHEEGKQIGLRYFTERGLREETIRKFQLGYSLEQRDDFLQTALAEGYKKEYLEKTGLVTFYEDGRGHDRFRGRVIFPIHTFSGKVVGFGGRILKKNDKTAKYMNSPESEIYHKSNELYGLYFAKQSISKVDKCFLVEGYTDVLSMHQAGVENVVASSGTALTQGQIHMIHRMTNNITMIYDGDAAGIKAAIRGIDLLLEKGMNVKVVLLPEGEDPDSFARAHTAFDFSLYIQEQETDFIRFKTELLLKEAGGDPIKRSKLISEILRSIAVIPDSIIRSVYIRECSNLLDISEQVLLNELNKIRGAKQQNSSMPITPHRTGPSTSLSAPTAQGPLDSTPGAPHIGSTPLQAPPGGAVSKPSPFKSYEELLLRSVVQYGELCFCVESEQGEERVISVAEYIMLELDNDKTLFETPQYQQILEEAVSLCRQPNFQAARHFLSHPNAFFSQTATMLMDENHQSLITVRKEEDPTMSKEGRKEVEEEHARQIEQLIHGIEKDILAFKEAHIVYRMKEVSQKIKALQVSGAHDDVMLLMQEQMRLNELKVDFSKRLGDRVILKI